MGYNSTCIAIKDIDEEAQVLSTLKLKKSARGPDRFDVKSSKREIVGGYTSTGWYLILDSTWELINSPELLSRLSVTKEVIGCEIGEGWNNSKAVYWSKGKIVWSAAHNLELGKEHLEEVGKLPDVYEKIKSKVIEEEANQPELLKGSDYFFSIPTNLFAELVGYTYDCDCEDLVQEYKFLKLDSSFPKKGILPDASEEVALSSQFEMEDSSRKTLRARRNIKSGELITEDSYLSIKESTEFGLPGKFEGSICDPKIIVGLKAAIDISKGEMIRKYHFHIEDLETIEE